MGIQQMPGLTVGPMGAWLSAVGVLRILHRADPEAVLAFEGTQALVWSHHDVLDTIADAVYSPIVTPWQSGGGWGDKDKTPARRLDALRTATVPQLAQLRHAVLAADKVLARRPDADKRTLVRELRNWLPEAALPWLDVAVPLHDNLSQARQEIGWAPLAGTGGNDGRWDLSTTYHTAALTLVDAAESRRRRWLADLIEGVQQEPLVDMSGGPYWPQRGDGDKPQLNPWAMILVAEGLLAFGDQPARVVHEQTQPWTSPDLGPDLDEHESGWGEAWLPLWVQPMILPEVQLILGGPWPRWRGRQARRPVEMLSALRTGGFPRGVNGFARYALARRRGRSHEAVQLETVTEDAWVPPTVEEAQQIADELSARKPGVRMIPMPVMLTADEAAARAGVARDTWTSYVSRGQAPPHDSRDPATGQRLWWEGTIEHYLAARPGRGARTDLDETEG